jgi:hypothetical protein
MAALFTLPGRRLIAVIAAGALVLVMSLVPSHAQDLGDRGRKSRGLKIEEPPKIDEKAYKSALERIPVPDKKYDPWAVARPSDQPKNGKKPN